MRGPAASPHGIFTWPQRSFQPAQLKNTMHLFSFNLFPSYDFPENLTKGMKERSISADLSDWPNLPILITDLPIFCSADSVVTVIPGVIFQKLPLACLPFQIYLPLQTCLSLWAHLVTCLLRKRTPPLGPGLSFLSLLPPSPISAFKNSSYIYFFPYTQDHNTIEKEIQV